MKLQDRHAIITGASEGLGEQVARRFVAEGASVLLCARRQSLLEKLHAELSRVAAAGQGVALMRVDVSREKDMVSMVRCAADQFPQIEILVNCAGVAGPRGPSDEVDWNEWRKSTDINLYGTVLPSLLAAHHMKQRRYGKIITMSGGGATKPLPHLSAYAAAKAGVVRFTETLAVELKDYHVDVNAVAPGVLATKLVDDFVEAGVEKLGKAYLEEVTRQRENSQPAFDVATGLCVYLASGESDGITGRLISAVWDPWENLQQFRADLDATDIYTLRRIMPKDRGKTWGDRTK
ncbi:MAG: SDR family oxidoreductase [bacterium]